MNEFENQEEIDFTRKDVLERIREYPIEELKTASMLSEWVAAEVKEAGLSSTPKGIILSLVKEAELYFDAGYPGESMKTLKRAEAYAKTKDGDTDIAHISYLKDISKELQGSISDM